MVRSAAALAAMLVAVPAFAGDGCRELSASVLRSDLAAPLPAELMAVAGTVIGARLATLQAASVEQVADTRGQEGAAGAKPGTP